jgi:hypothetical protein
MARLKNISDIKLADMLYDPKYSGLADGLKEFPLPDTILINGYYYAVPSDYNTFTAAICYGQRLYMAQPEMDDISLILRIVAGYYYPIVTGIKFNSDNALVFGKEILNLQVINLYPVAVHLISLTNEMIAMEQKLLFREPSKVEQAAGIEKLNVYSELSAIDFLSGVFKISLADVLHEPYNECLVRFMQAKAISEYQERFYQLSKESL